jgi:hypothetical protein
VTSKKGDDGGRRDYVAAPAGDGTEAVWAGWSTSVRPGLGIKCLTNTHGLGDAEADFVATYSRLAS